MNSDVAHRFRRARQIVVEPNIALDEEFPTRTSPAARAARPRRRAVFVGRLLPWKGTRLAIRALARVGPMWELHIYGDGPDREHLQALAARLDLADRVRFHGHRPRVEVLTALADADAFIFPSMHDSAGWVAGEASTVGCPVICFDHGGPPLLADVNARLVPVRGDVVALLARELAGCESRDGVAIERWSAQRLPHLTASWYRLALAAIPRAR
jgi:glycosyltransferase involved in cell wall biosynthesis